MIIKIEQTASNVKQEYDIYFENCYTQGKLGNLSEYQDIVLSNAETEIRGKYKVSQSFNYIPYRYLFGKTNVIRQFELYKDGNKYGNILYYQEGLRKNYYSISLNDNTILNCYEYAKESYNYVSIYKNEMQIALLKTNLSMNDYKYMHKLYLLDEFSQYKETLAFFVLYYSNYKFTKRFHMSQKSVDVRAWSFSKYNYKYNPTWCEDNFSV